MDTPTLDDLRSSASRACALLRVLAHEDRLVLLCRLAVADGPRTVTELSSCCGVHLSGVSRHLAKLKAAGIVSAEKTGREVRYRLERQALSSTLRRLADALDACCPGAPEASAQEPDQS